MVDGLEEHFIRSINHQLIQLLDGSIVYYLTYDELLDDKNEENCLKAKVTKLSIVNGPLLKGSYRITARTLTGETPLSLAYEVVFQIEVGISRCQWLDESTNSITTLTLLMSCKTWFVLRLQLIIRR